MNVKFVPVAVDLLLATCCWPSVRVLLWAGLYKNISSGNLFELWLEVGGWRLEVGGWRFEVRGSCVCGGLSGVCSVIDQHVPLWRQRSMTLCKNPPLP
jgi:hypothetical protein